MEKCHFNAKFHFYETKNIFSHFSDADIIIGGISPTPSNTSNFTTSISYIEDDYTWCIKTASAISAAYGFMQGMSTLSWILLVFGYGYGSSFILLLMIQFDKRYKQRNNRDWHYTTILIVLPAMTASSLRFNPTSWSLRLFYACMLFSMLAFTQVGMTFLFKSFQFGFFSHQIATVNELQRYELTLMGSAHVRDMVHMDERVGVFGQPKYLFFFAW